MEEERRALTHHIDELVAEMSTLRKERNELKEQLKEAMVFKVSFNEVQSDHTLVHPYGLNVKAPKTCNILVLVLHQIFSPRK